ncbi:Uncharacterised protein [uncultured archaeon]|nr:Uncharacterised protein [uncultured archaeon]
MKQKLAILALLIVIIAMTGFAGASPNYVGTICHSTGSASNPYVIIDFYSQQGFDSAWENGHGNGQGAHSGDFISNTEGQCAPPEQIPEFPTIALPAGAAIGLMFLFSRKNKKNKEE